MRYTHSPIHYIYILLLVILPSTAQAQDVSTTPYAEPKPGTIDIALTAGTTGVGIDLSTPITPWLTLRAGASYMPRVNIPFKYVYSVGDVEGGTTQDISSGKTKFKKMNELMYQITGTKINRTVHMDRHTMFDNVKLLFDVYPLNNKHWHATAGIYYGSRTFCYGENTLADATTFSCVAMYNEMYRKAVNNEPLISSNGTEFPEDIRQKFISYGKAHVYLGKFTHDIHVEDGHLIAKEGDTFYLEPDEDCTVTADARVNRLRPYLGIGYDGRLSKSDDRWRIGFNAGCMFWGGIPSVIVKYKESTTGSTSSPYAGGARGSYHEIDLMTDVTDLPYYAQKETDLVNALPVFPVLELRLSYRLK